MPKPVMPKTPFDGQVWVDAFRIQWVYNDEDDAWARIGVAATVPVARSDDNPAGPTNGLFSARDKILLDGLPPKAGGFGFILKPGYYLTNDNAADNVLSGDVKFVSETLKFDCITTNIKECGILPTVRVGLSDAFLESYRLEIQGPKGKTGNKGKTGRDGRPGTGDGPQGDPGLDGKDATTHHTFTGIEYKELDEVYDTAVVDLRLDAPNGTLEVTKARMNIPGDDVPASRVAAIPVIRDIEFLQSDLSQWQLVAPSDDPAATVDLNVIRLPKGWTGDSDSPVPVVAVKLSELVRSVVAYYQDATTVILDKWGADLKTWIVGEDEAARKVLHDLATELAECEFQLPLEFCIGISPADCNPARLGNVVIIVFQDESDPIYDTNAAYDEDLARYKALVAQYTGSLFTNIVLSVFVPVDVQIPTEMIIPPGVTPDGYTINNIGRPPELDELVKDYNTITAGQHFKADNIYLLVDNSGSMLTSTIEPGYGEFVDWLGSNVTSNVVEEEYMTERWLQMVCEYIEKLASEIQQSQVPGGGSV